MKIKDQVDLKDLCENYRENEHSYYLLDDMSGQCLWINKETRKVTTNDGYTGILLTLYKEGYLDLED